VFWAYGLTGGHDAVAQALEDQIAWLNPQVLAAVAGIQAASPTPPVIIVFSDHGARYSTTDVDERWRSFLATQTPGHAGLYTDDAVDVQLMATLFNGYFGEDIPLPDRATTIDSIGWESDKILEHVFPEDPG
jgi:hypothetical protein